MSRNVTSVMVVFAMLVAGAMFATETTASAGHHCGGGLFGKHRNRDCGGLFGHHKARHSCGGGLFGKLRGRHGGSNC
ncbi:MAG: hypothetical protein ACO1RT_16865, partial [Planctomycetaceae bacterium]